MQGDTLPEGLTTYTSIVDVDNRFPKTTHARRRRHKWNTCRFVLRLQPAGADSKLEAATREHVDAGRLLGQQRRVAEVIVEDSATDAER